MFERFRKKDEQRHAEQRADGVTDEPRHELDAKTFVEEEERRSDQHAAQAACECQADGPRPANSGVAIYPRRARTRSDLSRVSTRIECQRPSFFVVDE